MDPVVRRDDGLEAGMTVSRVLAEVKCIFWLALHLYDYRSINA